MDRCSHHAHSIDSDGPSSDHATDLGGYRPRPQDDALAATSSQADQESLAKLYGLSLFARETGELSTS